MDALILVDLQNDFCPGGALPVEEGDKTIPVANRLIDSFDLVVATQDWHPKDHGSFAANHPGMDIGAITELGGLPQILWPVHCVQGSEGAEFVKSLNQNNINKVFVKGTNKNIDSYSGFFDNGHKKSTGLHDFLQQNNVESVFIMGLALDYCVKYTAIDAANLGYKTYLVQDGCRGVGLNAEDIPEALEAMKSNGIIITNSGKILNI
jgi:nicotinamidase/pyrazinamidase